MVLSQLKKSGGISTQSKLIEALHDINIMEDIYDERNKVSKNALQQFRFRYLNPLLEKKWVKKEGRRRSAKIIITDKGQNMLLIFDKVYSG